MKKLYAGVCALFLFVQFSYGQWTTTGAATTTSNSVGIGTSTPIQVLHLRATSPIIQMEKTGILNWQAGNINDNDFGITVDNVAGTAFTIRSNTGYVGIGTTTPGLPLDARLAAHTTGVQNIAGFFNVDPSNGSGAALYIGGSATLGQGNARIIGTSFAGNDYRSQLQLQTTTTAGVWNTGLYINETGNVGIDTASPESGFKLDVNGLGTIGTQGSARIYLGTVDASHAFIQARDNSINQNLTLSAASYNFTVGNVGIGTTNPKNVLDVNGVISMQNFGYVSSQRSRLNNYTNLLLGGALKDNGDGTYTVVGDGGSNYFSAIKMDNSGGNIGSINFYSAPTTGGTSYNVTNSALSDYLKMTLVNGNLGIGISNPQEKLAVNGTIHSKMVVVDLLNWPDYVFKPTYHLTPLSEVKTYIDQNHHLPDMPSEKEVADNGLNLGEMNKLLAKKVEELTLYLIEKDKKLNDQQKAIESQENRLNTIEQQLIILSKK